MSPVMVQGERYTGRVAIRRGDWPVKPEAEVLDGQLLTFIAGWPIEPDEDRGGIYSCEWAMILPWHYSIPWIASGDIADLERVR